ncbi:hypothetical protein PV10_08883 [Exophiala mesophila]|uniref:DUF541 domain-containing protein n=1 Tax=Exophiala mesophila TaxID=212818 RepID=A0A0D1XMD5_EXOME|nr:uncharacterized protein PV10_08883 [Exophiala mesophila]KIV89306.1 hypothetical protein PV10_08883 [Exophiala mesophila]
MAPTVISIQGSATLRSPAERAVLTLEVASWGKEQKVASNDVVNTVTQLQTRLDESCPRLSNGDISPEAPISFYSIASLSTSYGDEMDKDGISTGQKVYRANTTIEIHFRDFLLLGKMVVYFSDINFVSLQGITWKLTDEKQAALEEQARTDALRHAIQRANNYAEVIGRTQVTPVKIQDSQQHLYFEGRVMQAAYRKTSSESFGIGIGIDFEPQVMEVKANLEVEFHAE